jgi:hypothetical protein
VSRKAAVKLLRRGVARYVDPRTIEMIESDYRYLPLGRQHRHSPAIDQVPMPAPIADLKGESLRTFARYPVDAKEFGR